METGVTTGQRVRSRRSLRIPSSFAAAVAEGLTPKQLGARFKIKSDTATRWMNDPSVAEQVGLIQEAIGADLRRRLRPALAKSVDVHMEALDASGACPHCKKPVPNLSLRLEAARSIMDRAGLPKAEITLLTGAVDLGDASDEQLEGEVVTDAADILDGWGQHELAEQVRAAASLARVDG